MVKMKNSIDDNVKRILIPRRNGEKLVGLFYTSKNTENKKIVILVHGFPGDKIENGRFPILANELTKEGIDVLAYDLPGYGENKREPILLSKQIESVEDVCIWAENIGYKSIGTLGLSIGGPSTLFADISNRKAAVFWAPAFNIPRYLVLFSKVLLKIRFFISKKPMKFRNKKHPKIFVPFEFFNEIQQMIPIKTNEKLQQFQIPTLILQGTTDPIIRPKYHKKVLKLLPDSIPKQLILIKFAGHNFKGKKLMQFNKYTVDFFKKYLI